MQGGVVEVGKGELSARDVCSVSEGESREEAVLRVYEVESKETGGANLLVEAVCVEIKAQSSARDGVLKLEY